jgi:hypothetical protein
LRPRRQPSGFGFRARPSGDRRRLRFFWFRVWALGLRLGLRESRKRIAEVAAGLSSVRALFAAWSI